MPTVYLLGLTHIRETKTTTRFKKLLKRVDCIIYEVIGGEMTNSQVKKLTFIFAFLPWVAAFQSLFSKEGRRADLTWIPKRKSITKYAPEAENGIESAAKYFIDRGFAKIQWITLVMLLLWSFDYFFSTYSFVFTLWSLPMILFYNIIFALVFTAIISFAGFGLVIDDYRNKVVVEAVKNKLRKGYKNIIVAYGGGHIKNIRKYLNKEGIHVEVV